MRLRGWLTLGLGLYVLFAVATFPAEYLLARIEVPNTRLHAVSGYWWKGSLEQIEIAGVNLGALDWHWSPLALFSGRLGVQLELNGALGNGRARLARGWSGNWHINALALRLPVEQGLEHFPTLPVEAEGQFVAVMNEAILSPAGVPQQLAGMLAWEEAELRSPVVASLQRLEADLTTADGELIARLSDRGGDLALDGQVRYDPASQVYRLDLALRARQNPDLQDTLSLLGQPDDRGYHHLERSGRLAF